MASPTVVSQTNTNVTTAADPWTGISYPGSPAAGQLLLMFARSATTPTFNTPTGWTSFVTNNTADATDDVTSFFWRLADGTETGTFSLDLTGSAKGCVLLMLISGAANPNTTPPEVQGSQPSTGTGANADPPSTSPAGGSKDYLFIAVMGEDGETNPTAQPSGYNALGFTIANSGTGGAVATNCILAESWKQATASSENPGTFTNAAPATGWSAWTVAVYPVAGFIEAPKIDVQQAVKRSSYY